MANSLKPAWLIRADPTYRGGLSSLLTVTKLRPSKCREVLELLTRSQRLNGNPRSQRLNGNSVPEVKWEKMATRAASLSGFLLFFVTCHAPRDVAQCHAICIFFTQGTHIWRGRECSWEILKNSKRRPTWAWANLFWSLKEDILLQETILLQYSFVESWS